MKKEKVLLMVLDGWGIRKGRSFNAVKLADPKNFNRLWDSNPHTTLFAAEEHVGLPKGFIGNSEVGHLHLGAGRMVPQELFKINRSIKDGSFFKNKVLLQSMDNVNNNGSSLHLMGLLSDGGVHSHINHLFALLELAKMKKVNNVYVHCFLDGRDVPPKSALKYLKMLEDKMKSIKVGKTGTVMGRFYAMDRDNRWNREHKAYDALVNGQCLFYKSATEAVKAAYARGETDEFVVPSIILSGGRTDVKYVKEHDSIIFFNFREDRARELTRAFVEGRFRKFKREQIIHLDFVCLTQYDSNIRAPAAFPPEVPKNTLADVISRNKLKQFRIAETEKYAHVTYFFNGGRESPHKFEERLMIPSPRVATYDKTPAMSAHKVTEEVIKKIKLNKYPLIIMNFANPDMVGHTGKLDETIAGIKVIDGCLQKVVDAARKEKYNVMMVADHGNAEEMTGIHKTSHTTNKVPFILISNKKYSVVERKDNSIANISPTILKIMGLKIPKEYADPLIE